MKNREEVTKTMDHTAIVKNREEFKSKVDEFNHEGQIAAANVDIEAKKEALKEAKDVAIKAAAQDQGAFSVAQPGAEAVRTETLAHQAEVDLDKAEAHLKSLEKSDESAQQPVPQEQPVVEEPVKE